MKRNLVPLFGIAFVVAMVATGVFYGLFVSRLGEPRPQAPAGNLVVAAARLERGTVLKDEHLKTVPWTAGALPKHSFTTKEKLVGQTVVQAVDENEPLTETRLASAHGSGGLPIPKGMRAISLHVADTGGLLTYLQTGQRVDVQAYSAMNGRPELKTVAQDLEIAGVHGPEQGNQPMVTVIATPLEADILALADSTSRLRLLLRNPLEKGVGPRSAMLLPQVFSGAVKQPVVATAALDPATKTESVSFDVRVAEFPASAVGQIAAVDRDAAGRISVAGMVASADVDRAISKLEQQGQIATVSNRRVQAPINQAVWLESPASSAGKPALKLQLQLLKQESSGALHVKVLPEATLRSASARSTRKLETQVDLKPGQGFVVLGFDEPSAGKAPDRQTVMLVRPRLQPTLSSALR